MASKKIFLLSGLLLVFWATRIIGIDAFPPFIDEAFHVNFGTNVLNSSLLVHSDEGRQLTIWWYVLLQTQPAAQIFVARTATLLIVLLGAAAAVGAARLLAGYRGAAFAGLLFIFSTYLLFFDRLALADPVSGAVVLVAIYFAARLSRRSHMRDAVLCGLVLFVAVGAKISALPYLGVPAAAMLALRPPGRSWKVQVRWGLTAILTAGALTAGFLLLLFMRSYNPFFYLQGAPTTASGSAYLDKLSLAWMTLSGYASTPAAIILIALIVLLLVRRRWFLPLCLLAPFVVLSVSSRQDSRHLYAPMVVLLLCGAVALGSLSANSPKLVFNAAWIGVLIWGGIVWLPFVQTTLTSPADLALTPNDRDEYVLAEGSGFGLREALTALEEAQPERVIGILANCLSLRYLAGSTLAVECPRLNPNGEDRDTLAAMMDVNRQQGVFVVLEDIPYAPSTAPGRQITSIEFPPGRPRLTIYDLSPQP